MEIRSLSQLEKALKKKIQQAMENEVAVKAVSLGQENVVQEVYETYEPVAYERQYEMMTAFEVNPVADGIEFSHNRTDGDRNVSEIVETGQGYQYTKVGAEYMNPRPFFSTTVEELKDGEFKKALKDGLTKAGLKVE